MFGDMMRGLLPQLALGDTSGVRPEIPRYEPIPKGPERVPTIPDEFKSDLQKNLDKTRAALLKDDTFNEAIDRLQGKTIELPGQNYFTLPQDREKVADYLVNANAHLVSTQDPPEAGKEPQTAAAQIGYRFNMVRGAAQAKSQLK